MADAAPSHSPLGRFPYRGFATPVVRVLLLVHLGAWALIWAADALSFVRYGQALEALALQPAAVLEGLELWRLVTYSIVHPATPFTLLLSCAVLLWLGREVETLLGSVRFAALYATATLLVAGTVLLLGRGVEPPAHALGSGGAALAVLVTFTGYHPRDRLVLLRIFAVEAWLLCIALVALGVAAAALDAHGLGLAAAAAAGAEGAATTGSKAALALGHVFGGFVGLLWVRAHHRVEAWVDQAARRRFLAAPKKMAAAAAEKAGGGHAPGSDLESETDRILEKIAREGMQSLTPHERGLLEKASQHFRRRRPTGPARAVGERGIDPAGQDPAS